MRRTPSLLQRAQRLLKNLLPTELSTVKETDETFFGGRSMSSLYRDRNDYDREKVLSETLRAWRINPIARRIVKLITQFVIGKGIAIESRNKPSNKFLQEWINHPLNRIYSNLSPWMDEVSRAGNMFFLFSVDDTNGMSFVRAVAADQIKEIQTAQNDVSQETYYIPQDLDLSPYEAYSPLKQQKEFMLHFAVNRPVGTTWGEPDLAPLLPWIGRYASWLEDRVRLNRFRNAFMYVVRGQFKNKTEKDARQKELLANPPQPGSILVTDPSEDWGILSANLDSFDASVDGLTIKKMILAGTPFPLHYLAEPESGTSTTAEAAGTPTFRGLQDIQREFCYMLESIAITAIQVRNRYTEGRKLVESVQIKPQDISERDNATLALAFNRSYANFADMFDRGLIDEAELMRLSLRFAGETWEEKAITGMRRPLKPTEAITPESEPTPNEPDANEE